MRVVIVIIIITITVTRIIITINIITRLVHSPCLYHYPHQLVTTSTKQMTTRLLFNQSCNKTTTRRQVSRRQQRSIVSQLKTARLHVAGKANCHPSSTSHRLSTLQKFSLAACHGIFARPICSRSLAFLDHAALNGLTRIALV